MDLAIKNGDFLTDGRGRPVSIFGMDEILQRALIRLSVKKGSFVYDTKLGSDLYKLKISDKNLKSKALSFIKEALYKMPDVTVEDISINLETLNEIMHIHVKLFANGNSGEVEITQ